ncbi:hypothetical protein JCM15831A_14970 [Asaia astilbis]
MPYHYSKSTRLFYDDEESYSDMPSDVVAVTDEQHSLLFLALKNGAAIIPDSNGSPSAVSNGGYGSLIDLSTVTEDSNYIPAPTLAKQASDELSSARGYVYNNYGILNEATPDAWVSYLKSLMAIANGSDTTSTALPKAPTA